jgi:hypothetical protein
MRLPFRPNYRRQQCRRRGRRRRTTLDVHIVKLDFDMTPYQHNLNLHSVISSGRLTQARELFDGCCPT